MRRSHLGPVLLTLLSIGSFTVASLQPSKVQAAESVRFLVAGPVTLNLSVESLESFAETGELTGDLKLLSRFNPEAIANLRNILQRRLQFDVVTVDQITYSPLGRELVAEVGKLIGTDPKRDGFHGLRAAMIRAAANAGEEGWTALDVLKAFPTSPIDIPVSSLTSLARELSVYSNYTESSLQAVYAAADQQAQQETVAISGLPDISERGSYGVTRSQFTVSDPSLRQTTEGLSVDFSFDVDFYRPQGLKQPAPAIVISHGFGSQKENFSYMAEHFASHGFAVLIPNHVGSSLAYRKVFLQNRLTTLLSPVEYINRPQEISLLLDEVEQLVASDPGWMGQVDLERIGVLGNSLGGATALSIAGAELNFPRLQQECQGGEFRLDASRLLQCRALFLPPIDYNLHDDRIKALVTGNQLSNILFGPESIGNIDIPTLMLSGSGDLVTPPVLHQIHPFIWLNTPDKYLAMLTPGTHFSTSIDGAEGGNVFPEFLWGKYHDSGRRYYKSLATAFFQTHLAGREEFSPYLTASYGRALSRDSPMQLHISNSLTPEQLTTVYGATPPVSIIPTISDLKLGNISGLAQESVLDEIRRTGVMKVALRRDAAPLGYIDNEGAWTGYCTEFVEQFSQQLTVILGLNQPVQVAELPSNLRNRFDLVRDGTVHFECGPNSINSNVPDIQFSQAFFITGTHLLTQAGSTINPALPLQGVNLGVLENTTTETRIRQLYPQASITTFSGDRGRTKGVEALSQGRIEAFASDRILLAGELQQQKESPSGYAFLPEQPLSCDFYGLALRKGDSAWRQQMNDFIESETGNALGRRWFSPFSTDSETLTTLEYCLNQ